MFLPLLGREGQDRKKERGEGVAWVHGGICRIFMYLWMLSRDLYEADLF